MTLIFTSGVLLQSGQYSHVMKFWDTARFDYSLVKDIDQLELV